MFVPLAANDTLTLQPTAGAWPTGFGWTLTVNVNDAAGNPVPPVSRSFDIFTGVVFVHPIGNDSNDGTPQAPLATVQAGLDKASALEYVPGSVLVGAGTYTADYRSTEIPVAALTVDGISLYGGYSATDWSVRDPAVHVTTLQDTSSTGGDTVDPNRAVYVSTAITGATVLDGFTVQGGAGDMSSGAFVEGDATLRNNVFQGGSGDSSNGILLYGTSAAPLLTGNTLHGGSGTSASYGVLALSGPRPILRGNALHGGSGNWSYGLRVMESIATVEQQNTIDGGTGVVSRGVDLYDADVTIVDSTISGGGGSGTSSRYGIYGGSLATGTVARNSITGGSTPTDVSSSYGIWITAGSDLSIDSNPLIDGGSVASGTTYGIGIHYTARADITNNPDIRGGSGANKSYGIYIYSTPTTDSTIHGNTIDGGSGGSETYGIYGRPYTIGDATSPSIVGNVITGGEGPAIQAYGIDFPAGGTPLIEGNRIQGARGGTPNSSYAIGLYFDANATIRNNVLHAGTGGETYGVMANRSDPVVQNNTIDGGSGSAAFGIYLQATDPYLTLATIQNNIVITRAGTGSSCMYEKTATSDPATFDANDLFGCAVLYYDDYGLTTIEQVNALPEASATNVSADPLFADPDGADDDALTMADNDWHLTASSPATVTQGGLDLSAQFTTDMDGVTRTAVEGAWSMGAYEYDP
jgi:hypothetical protein